MSERNGDSFSQRIMFTIVGGVAAVAFAFALAWGTYVNASLAEQRAINQKREGEVAALKQIAQDTKESLTEIKTLLKEHMDDGKGER